MLKDILEQKKCFKLVCGAGNEDATEVEKLVAVYAKAGANYFDLSAKEDVVKAAFKGLRRVVDEKEITNYYFNVSVGIKGDPHVSKAKIIDKKCSFCGKCYDICLNKAINNSNGIYSVNSKKCIGCGACAKECPVSAILLYSQPKPLNEVLPPLIKLGIHSLEFHAVSDNEEQINVEWTTVNSCFNGILSLCTDRSHASDIQLIKRIQMAIKDRAPFTTIIQADGAPMSGCDDNPETTLQALATAQIVQRANLPVFLLLSGGTNSKTTEFAKEFNINAHGVAIGSYARKIIREYIDRDDFLENKDIFDKALIIAKELVDKSMRFMQ